jgi:enoyl-CoA hydratase/carnithine racemase
LKEISALKMKSAFDYSRNAHRLFGRIEQCGKPIIACVNGMAMGGGAELALSCHLRVVSEGAQLGFPESGLGGIPGMGGTQRLPRLIGRGIALSYLLTGDMMKPDQGLQCGLFQKVFPEAEVEGGTEKLAKKLAKKSPLSLKFIIQAVTKGVDGDIEEGLALESALMAIMTGSEDSKEGIKAIFEKRPLSFKGK